ncbi:ABC transporter substrate-binding protein [Methylophilus aquaticus]|uniref:ABC transporter substrate-binding protein n=1 Tax=Methylophilus aquaticus TaxID=1971610 RepID=A0ABT9JSW8_9PROT|nr:ABC transporter substrate-binding protein [Methylophilus aquaticus]MDP8567621.1 ABC transporter substrate-binding protein [Methylophilus aquaticus]
MRAGQWWKGALIATLWMLSGCQSSSSNNVLVFAVAQAPINLDPRYATDAASERANRLLYQRLVEFDSASHEVAGLSDWQQIDARHYRFHLKPQAAPFHHGQPLTAQDVKATYDSLLALPDSPHVAEFKHIQRIDTPDARTIDFTLNRPDSHFPARLIIGILPADLVAAGHDFTHQPVGNGPFRLNAWSRSLVLTRVRDGLQVCFNEVKDPNVRVLKLKRGEADLIQGDLPPELVSYLQAQPGLMVQTAAGANYSYLGINTQADYLRDSKVRQAIAYAIDTDAIIRKVMVPHTRSANAILPPEHYAGNRDLQPYRYQPALSRQLLQSAGIKLPLTLIYKTSTDAQRVRLATILQAQMREAGIDLHIKSLDWGTFFSDVQQGNFQLYGLTWVGIKTPEIYTKVFASANVPPVGVNRGRYRDSELDRLLAAEDWMAATRRIHSRLPYIPLWYEGQFAAYRPSIQTYAPMPDGNWDGLSNVVFKASARQTSGLSAQ